MRQQTFKGGSNPFKKSGTQYAKDQKEIRKLLKKPKPKTKAKRKGATINTHRASKPIPKDKIIINASIGESIIADWLRKHNIKFTPEKRFTDLLSPITGKHLRFDFYLDGRNTCIEFDGEQHFKYVECFDKGDRTLVKQRKAIDKFKNNYCKHKRMNLIRIPYKLLNELDIVLCHLVL